MVTSLHGWNFFYRRSCTKATILLYFALLFISIFPNSVVSKLRSYICSNGTASDSTFEVNLNRVIHDLLRNTPQTGFNTSSHGHAPYKVYGLLQCWGNVSPQDCASCLKEANSLARDLCPATMGASVWTEMCFLRYGSSNFFSKLDTNGHDIVNAQDITTDLDAFKNTTSSLLSNLCREAYDPANKGFAMGSLNYSTADKVVYGRVQCLRDISIQDCRSCLSYALKNLEQCCSAKEGAQYVSESCTVRYETYPFYSIPLLPPFHGPHRKSSKNLPLILGVAGGVMLLLAAFLFGLPIKMRSAISGRLIRLVWRNQDMYEQDPASGLLKHERHLIISLKTLRKATGNFDTRNKLGEGGFGAVYKGTIRDGKEIAVKKLSAVSKQGKKEFMNEVKLVANIQHRNLVKLLGCCIEGEERLLVYEYLQNRSLDRFIFEPDPGKREQLDWHKRYRIIMGIARGLLYLHEDSQIRIIHRDIKANNILLDENLNPKIADFGLARLFPDNETYVQTRVAGTYGYMAPEYAMRGQLSLKADVYSFGVLLLEILSGRRNTDINLPWEMQSLLEWAWKLYKEGNVLTIMDWTIRESCSEEEALRCIRVGLLCVQSDATLRPHISGVITMMSGETAVLPNPIKPAFVRVSKKNGSTSPSRSISRLDEHEQEETSPTSASTFATTCSFGFSPGPVTMIASTNDASVTEVEAR